MNVTPIEWTTFSANPIKYRDANGKTVWACVHHSPGCLHCYSETLAKRYGRGGPFNVPTTSKVTPFLDEKELRQMLTAKRIGGQDVSGSRCFVGDMTDIFGEWVSDELLDQLFAVFALRSDVTWQVLTKRADRMREYLSYEYRWAQVEAACDDLVGRSEAPALATPERKSLPNVHLGVSCEDQQRADERIPMLLQTPAAVRFISAEPLLGSINLSRYFYGPSNWNPNLQLHWVIVGGESGSGARPCELEWIRAIVAQCESADVACFVKQLGAVPGSWASPVNVSEAERQSWMRDGWTRVISAAGESFTQHLRLKDRKGGDISEWPKDLRVRQFPIQRIC